MLSIFGQSERIEIVLWYSLLVFRFPKLGEDGHIDEPQNAFGESESGNCSVFVLKERKKGGGTYIEEIKFG